MGGCASKPNNLDTVEKAPAPVEAPAAEALAATDKAEVETAAQETKDGDETEEKPVVVESSSEPAPEAANTEEAEVKEAAEPAVQAGELKEAKTEAEEQVKETPTEEKKEVAETAATA
ncbi:hypothetical protein OROGR_025884 [Orobanche gracilis]